MKTIYLVDYIGNHCGMHYYLQAFKDTLQQIDNIEVSILSNYTTNGTKPFFLNQYEGNSINKVFSLIKNFYRLRQFIGLHPNDTIVYLTYGNIIDIPFIKLTCIVKYCFIALFPHIGDDIRHNGLVFAVAAGTAFQQIIQNILLRLGCQFYFLHVFTSY